MVTNHFYSLRQAPQLKKEQFPDREVFETMWELFVALGEFRKVVLDHKKMKPCLEVYMAVRVQNYPFYREEYRKAAAWIREQGIKENKDYENLFSDHNENNTPPGSPKDKLRQLVINEFAYLQMIVGGEQVPKAEIKHLKSMLKGN